MAFTWTGFAWLWPGVSGLFFGTGHDGGRDDGVRMTMGRNGVGVGDDGSRDRRGAVGGAARVYRPGRRGAGDSTLGRKPVISPSSGKKAHNWKTYRILV